jgi:hypothetical protein
VRRGHLTSEFDLVGRGLINAQQQVDRQRLCFCAFRKRLRRSDLYKAAAQNLWVHGLRPIQELELRPQIPVKILVILLQRERCLAGCNHANLNLLFPCSELRFGRAHS